MLADPRYQKWAKVLVNYCLALKPGDKFRLSAQEGALPLFEEVYREAIRAGAHVTTRFSMTTLEKIFYHEASEEQLKHVSEIRKFEIEHFDAQLFIGGETDTRYLSGVDPKRLALHTAAQQPIARIFDERSAKGDLRWCYTMFPTQAYADDAGLKLSDYETFVLEAMLLHLDDPVAAWQAVRDEQQRIVDFLESKNEIYIVTPDTDIRYRTAGRKWINCYGDKNFPDGEVFTAPLEDSVNGHVRFTFPAVYDGNEVEDVRLTFREGKVIEASAAKGLDFLNAMLDMDGGSRTLGEAAFGLNYGIQRYSKSILFDEKIGGTMHMALGQAYGECGGKNESGLHWDMVCDLRQGKVFADGELCYENGKFII